MKTLSLALALALAAGSLTVAPAAFAQTPAPAASAHGYINGDRMPFQYTNTDRYRIFQVAEYSLPEAPKGFRWILIDDTAYLVQNDTDRIMQHRKVTKA